VAFLEMMRADGYDADRLDAIADDFGGPYDAVFADAVFLHFDRSQLADVLRKSADAANVLAFSVKEGKGEEWSNRYLDLPRHFVLWQEEPLRALLASTGWTAEQFTRTEFKNGGWFQVLASRR
jgi:hypothetical protein